MPDHILSYAADLTSWRRHLHQHPELAFEEHATADFIASLLTDFGIKVHRGLAGTGVVGSLTAGTSKRAIGLRADMDALPLQEENHFPYASVHNHVMHACGHDGHSAMLLGAARYLAETRNFDGTVYFIFQPAEEAAGGARVMIEDGLFEIFPMDAVHGMHNMPNLSAGHFAMRVGAQMAAFDSFDIVIRATGTHAALPHLGSDAIVAASAIITAAQTIVSREIDPTRQALLSFTRIKGGDNYNILPGEVLISGCCRSFDLDIQKQLRDGLVRVSRDISVAHRTTAEVRFLEHYPATISTADGIRAAANAALDVVGTDRVTTDTPALMASEDFGYMLQVKPGSYILIGNGPGDGGCMLHNAHYDFNDEILVTGARYWARLAERELAAGRPGQATARIAPLS
ncbi:M20 aminoacylase family protein [Govanella unica]|uniref:M20 family metallopeptidase n=1 Tax=Govanella unica TaxID=2975056 RepID=A0A9X3Z6L3_9PROT|nr:M20 aminoacylase family protein [Govania unica]MDA5193143.1 M20 family metallopeptidase [Govania unica]